MRPRLPRTFKQLLQEKKKADYCEPIYSSHKKNEIVHFWQENEPGIIVKTSDRRQEMRDEVQYNLLAKAMKLKTADIALYEEAETSTLAIQFIPGVTAAKFCAWNMHPNNVTYSVSEKMKLTHVATAILGLVDAHDENILVCPHNRKIKDSYDTHEFSDATIYVIDTAYGFKTQKDLYPDLDCGVLDFDPLRESVGLLFDFQQGILDINSIEDVEFKKFIKNNMSEPYKYLLQAEIPHDDYIRCAMEHKISLQENQAMLEKDGLGEAGLALQQRCDDMVEHLQMLKRQNKPI